VKETKSRLRITLRLAVPPELNHPPSVTLAHERAHRARCLFAMRDERAVAKGNTLSPEDAEAVRDRLAPQG
jgi:hypothetical protein